jgi:hypothetical protein
VVANIFHLNSAPTVKQEETNSNGHSPIDLVGISIYTYYICSQSVYLYIHIIYVASRYAYVPGQP